MKTQIEKFAEEKDIFKGCGKEDVYHSNANHKWFNCGEAYSKEHILYCDECKARQEGYNLGRKDLLNYFKKESLIVLNNIKEELAKLKAGEKE